MVEQNGDIKVNRLYYEALKNMEKAVPARELRNIDMTDVFWTEIAKMQKAGDYVNISVTGKTVTGKSTLGAEVATEFNEDLLGVKMGMGKYCPDQVWFNRRIMDERVKNVMLWTDEYSTLGESGYSSTVDSNLSEWFSEVCAQRFVHRVNCSAHGTLVDPTSSIYIECMKGGIDKAKKTVSGLLYWNLDMGTTSRLQLLGTMTVDVSRALSAPWYKDYMEMKHAIMKLTLEDAIMNLRVMEQARLVIGTYREMYVLAKWKSQTKDDISNFVERIKRENKQMMSILTDDAMLLRVKGLLNMVTTSEKLSWELRKLNEKAKNDGENGNAEYREELRQAIMKINDGLGKNLDNYHYMAAKADELAAKMRWYEEKNEVKT